MAGQRALNERYELIKLTSLTMCGFIAPLVEHRTSIAEITGSYFQFLKLEVYCDDHSSLLAPVLFGSKHCFGYAEINALFRQ